MLRHPVIHTDIYPTRYVAFQNPGSWAVFKPIDGLYRHCREDAPRRPSSELGAGKTYPGEMAILSTAMKSDGIWRGTFIEIGGAPGVALWGADNREDFRALCHHTYDGGPVPLAQVNKTIFRPTLEEAMQEAEQWMETL